MSARHARLLAGTAGLLLALGLVALGCGPLQGGHWPGPPNNDPYASIQIAAGDHQSGLAGVALVTSLVVTTRYQGALTPGRTVWFGVVSGGGTLSAPSGWIGNGLATPGVLGPVAGPSINVNADSQGQARVTWTLGPTPGWNSVAASFPTIDTSEPSVSFTATGN